MGLVLTYPESRAGSLTSETDILLKLGFWVLTHFPTRRIIVRELHEKPKLNEMFTPEVIQSLRKQGVAVEIEQ